MAESRPARAAPGRAGQDSALVSAGFFAGFAIGPPLFGLLAAAGQYGARWLPGTALPLVGSQQSTPSGALARGREPFFKDCEHPRSRWSKCPHPYKIRYRSAAG